MQAAFFYVAVHVLESGVRSQGLLQAAAPGAQGVQVVGLEGVLVLRARAAAAHHDVLSGLQKDLQARLRGQLAAQASDNALCADFAFLQRLEGDKDPGPAAAA